MLSGMCPASLRSNWRADASEASGAEHLGPFGKRQDMIPEQQYSQLRRGSPTGTPSKATGKLEGPQSAATTTAATTPGVVFDHARSDTKVLPFRTLSTAGTKSRE